MNECESRKSNQHWSKLLSTFLEVICYKQCVSITFLGLPLMAPAVVVVAAAAADVKSVGD